MGNLSFVTVYLHLYEVDRDVFKIKGFKNFYVK